MTEYAIDNYNTESPSLAAHASGISTRYDSSTSAAYDQLWGIGYNTTLAPHNYFDYYFSGQDIKVYIDGADDPTGLPLMDLAFSISQQKQPVFGFWSYTFDQVMRGTRIVNGQFRIATKSTNYMTDLISQAAQTRMAKATITPIRELDADETNIEKYWTQNIDPATMGYKQLFSTHPPFNFIIVYGLQPISISPTGADKENALYKQYQSSDNQLVMDQNHRLVEADAQNYTMRYVVQSVELTGMQTDYGSDGQIISETYSFFAKDMFNMNTDNVR